jgi:hypothetical protein
MDLSEQLQIAHDTIAQNQAGIQGYIKRRPQLTPEELREVERMEERNEYLQRIILAIEETMRDRPGLAARVSEADMYAYIVRKSQRLRWGVAD